MGPIWAVNTRPSEFSGGGDIFALLKAFDRESEFWKQSAKTEEGRVSAMASLTGGYQAAGSTTFANNSEGAAAWANYFKSGGSISVSTLAWYHTPGTGDDDGWATTLRSTLIAIKGLFSDQAEKLNIKPPDAAAITLSASLNGLSGIGGSISLGYVGNDFGYYYSWGPQLGSPDISISLGLSATYFTTDTPPVMSSMFGNGRGGGMGIGFLSSGYSQGLDNFGIPNSHSFYMGGTIGHPLGGSVYYSPGTITNGYVLPPLNLGKRF